MIVVDTNVVSELMRATPAAKVLSWFAKHPAARLYVTTITVAEVLTGIALLPRGRRKDTLDRAATAMFDEDFSGRCLAFDLPAASHYAAIMVTRRRDGRPVASMDAQIAGIARSRGAALATRNIDDFDGCGVDLIDPWA